MDSGIMRYAVTIDGETTHIGTANELAVALDVLQGHHDRAVLEQLAPHLAEVVGGPIGLTNVFKSLSPEDQIYLLQTVDGELAGLLQEARHLRDLLAALSVAEVEQCLLETLGTRGLRTLIVTGAQLAQVLEWVYGDCDKQLMDLLGADYVRRLVRNGSELALVLNCLEETGQQDLLEKLGWPRVVELITDGRELAYLMRALPPAQSGRLLDQYSRERIVDLIGNERDWDYLFKRLEAAEAAQLLSKLEVDHHAK